MAVPPPALLESFGATIIEGVYKGRSDYMVVLGSEQELVNLDVNMIVLSTIPARGIIITAPGTDVDFVSRFFAPQSGIDEDPVTGSTHTMLVPYWAEKFSKTVLTAKQLSKRGGYLACELDGDVVHIGGRGEFICVGRLRFD